jgi:hypothetical protein
MIRKEALKIGKVEGLTYKEVSEFDIFEDLKAASLPRRRIIQ